MTTKTAAPVRRRPIPVRQPPITPRDAAEALMYDMRAALSRVPLSDRLAGIQNFAATIVLTVSKRESPKIAGLSRKLLAAIEGEAKKRQIVMPSLPKAVLR